jgi:XTP/dITP diphosphohydrolase
MTGLPRLVVASANPEKVAEIALVLDGLVDLEPRPLEVPDVVEDGDTLEANARLKAVAICTATGRAAVADDTGLEVDALGGAPGVHSARYAGEECDAGANMARLLAELDGVPIAEAPAGDAGFGYDPLFVPIEGDGRTFAEMGDEKHAVSHRGRAFRDLARRLAACT